MDTLRKLSDFKALRRVSSVAALMILDSVALAVGLVAAAYLSGADLAAVTMLSPVLFAAWVVLFAAFDLYNRAGVRRAPGSLVLAVLCWTGLVFAGALVYPEVGLVAAEVLLAGALAMPAVGMLRFLYERGIERIYRRGF
ncbi:MAG: hypothetical protein WKF44_06060, partial [Rubrobacteraceae bacterium]